MKSIKNNILKLLPGTIICSIIATLSKYLGSLFPLIGTATFCIFIGIFARNTFLKSDKYLPGAKFCENNLLSYSIFLLGGTLSFKTILNLGPTGLIFILLQMIATIFVAVKIGNILGFSKDFSYLMASGNAVCGSSAISSTATAINAENNDKTISITIVNLTGTLLMILLPILTKLVFNHDPLKTSAMIGGILQSVGQVVACGSMITPYIQNLSTLFKIVRVIFLVFVVFLFTRSKNNSSKKETILKSKTKIKIPIYIIGFFILCILYSLDIIPNFLSDIFKYISNIFEIVALVGIGMRVDFALLIKQGLKGSLYGLLIAVFQITSALILINIIL